MRGVCLLIVLMSIGSVVFTGCGGKVEQAKASFDAAMSDIGYDVKITAIKTTSTTDEVKEFMEETLPQFLISEKKNLQYTDKMEKNNNTAMKIHKWMLSDIDGKNKEKIISEIKKFKEEQNNEGKQMAEDLLSDVKKLASKAVPEDAQPFYGKSLKTMQLNRKLILEYVDKNNKICDYKLELIETLRDNPNDVKNMEYIEKVEKLVKEFTEVADEIVKEANKQEPTNEEMENFNKVLKGELDKFSDVERDEYAKLIRSKGLDEFFPSLFGNNAQSNSNNEISNTMLGNVKLGDSLSEAEKVLGEPTQKTEKEAGKLSYVYPLMDVAYDYGEVTGMAADDVSVTTPMGIHAGSSLQEVLNVYGTGYMLSTYGGLDLYEYKYKDEKQRAYLLRFAVKQNSGVVDYISIRYVD